VIGLKQHRRASHRPARRPVVRQHSQAQFLEELEKVSPGAKALFGSLGLVVQPKGAIWPRH
jgi:hypothetical protein